MFSLPTHGRAALLPGSLLVFLFLLTFDLPSLQAQKSVEAPAGAAWKVSGQWKMDGTLILTGDAVKPGSLLRPGDEPGSHSITILLPDGQRILCDCFTAKDCARGFRVPQLYRAPDPFAVDMLRRIRAVLVRENQDSLTGSGIRNAPQPARDEAVAVLGPDNRVQVQGLAATLPSGRYTYDLRPLDRAHPRQFHLVIEKNSPAISLELPASGLYILSITDEMNTPRINLFLAAVSPAQAESIQKSFRDANKLIEQWNADYSGWPVHDLRRAYLESLMPGPKPPATAGQAGKDATEAGVGARSGGTAADLAGVTAEPAFFPKPGIFTRDTAVTLRCDTPGAAIHYTVDGSQPMASSPVYGAPIIVMGTELTIKSFASAAGKKDSAVVTGIFRIGE
jgi:hypothetical protein